MRKIWIGPLSIAVRASSRWRPQPTNLWHELTSQTFTSDVISPHKETADGRSYCTHCVAVDVPVSDYTSAAQPLQLGRRWYRVGRFDGAGG